MTDLNGRDRCGIGIRGVAMAIDLFVWLAWFFVSVFVVGAATGELQATADGTSANLEGTAASLSFGLWLALSIGYHALLEWRYGQTLGKHLVSIEVVHEDGSQLSPRSSAIRNVARLVDWLPAFYLAGMVAIAISSEPERIGDRLGGTVVVR